MPQPSSQDIVHGVDLSAAPNVTGAILNTLVDNAVPVNGIGFIIWTTDADVVNAIPTVPNPATSQYTTKWTYYIWGRIQPYIETVTFYFWNPAAGSGALLQWQAILDAAIGPGSITGSQIANNTITAINIASCNVASLINSGAVAGQMLIVSVDGISVIPVNNIYATTATKVIGAPGATLSVNAGGTDLQYNNTQILTNISAAILGGTIYGQVRTAHTLGVVPSKVRIVLQCIVNDANTSYLVGDELNLDCIVEHSDGHSRCSFFADNTTVSINYAPAASYASLVIRTGTAAADITSLNNFKFKVYLGV